MARILVIDDDADLREVMQETLVSSGHDVMLAANGSQGLEQQREHPADVVITDIFMPDKEGIETIRELRQEFPGVRIIAMSGGGVHVKKAGYLSTASELGADAVLHKPFEPAVLLDSIRTVLKQPG